MDSIYKYNPNVFYKPNEGRYLQLISTKDLYIQNISVSEDDNHSDSFQVKFLNVFTNCMNREMRVEDQKFIDWDHYRFTLWQTQLNCVIFCASSACSVSVEHMNAKKQMMRISCLLYIFYISISCLLSYQKNIKNTRNSTAI